MLILTPRPVRRGDFLNSKSNTMNNYNPDNNTLSCTIAGTLLALLNSINPGELLNTVIIAATGALVSFIVSLFCKYLWHKITEEIDR